MALLNIALILFAPWRSAPSPPRVNAAATGAGRCAAGSMIGARAAALLRRSRRTRASTGRRVRHPRFHRRPRFSGMAGLPFGSAGDGGTGADPGESTPERILRRILVGTAPFEVLGPRPALSPLPPLPPPSCANSWPPSTKSPVPSTSSPFAVTRASTAPKTIVASALASIADLNIINILFNRLLAGTSFFRIG